MEEKINRGKFFPSHKVKGREFTWLKIHWKSAKRNYSAYWSKKKVYHEAQVNFYLWLKKEELHIRMIETFQRNYNIVYKITKSKIQLKDILEMNIFT